MARVSHQIKVLLLRMTLSLGCSLYILVAQGQGPVTNFQLRPGVIVNVSRGQVYLMNPDGGISAVELGKGKEIWRSTEAAKPLAIAGDVLISQAEPLEKANELRIVGLNAREAGRRVVEKSVELPLNVKASIQQALNRSFTADARLVAGGADVTWEYVERPLRGPPPGRAEVLPGESPPGGPFAPLATKEAPAVPVIGLGQRPGTPTIRGTFRLLLPSASINLQQVETALVSRTAETVDVPAAARLPDVQGPQFLSADGKHVLSSQRRADDSVWEKYLWTIYDRNTARRLGEIRQHVSYTPFFVVGSRIIYETGPYVRRTEAGIIEEPLQIQAVDLLSGKKLWSQPVRDVTDRRAPPP